ncbi:MAG: DUF3324 domain-containing protein [Actinobacteria bacterium]|nr:DUF3324 domain-containing protein [Actinomycetota bacterium]
MTSKRKNPRGGRLRRVGIACAVAGAFALLAPPGAALAAGPTFALAPASPTETGYFVLDAKGGKTLHESVTVTNVGGKAGSTRLYAVDATTGQTSGAVYRSRTEPRRGVGRWISLGKTGLTLEPGESRVVPFAVRIPAGTSAGQYLGGIVTQRYTKTVKKNPGGGGEGEEGGGFKIKIQALSVLAVQVDVPGTRRARMNLTGIKPGGTPGHQALLLGIQNSGNVLTKGSGSLRVVNSGGRQVQRQEFALDTFVPDTRIDFPVYVQGKALPPGSYRGTVTISYRGRQVRRTFPFSITSSQVKQVFGSTAQSAPPPPSGGGSSDTTLIVVLGGVAALSLGAAGYFFLRTRGAV